MEFRGTRQLDPSVELRLSAISRRAALCRGLSRRGLSRGLASFSGGFIGVDVFFVLSGFLVTRILLGDLVTGGRVNFRRFYSRRFRRILPAAAVMLLVTAAVYVVVASPLQILHRSRRLPRLILVLRELALHSTVDRLLRDQRQLEPGVALLVTRGRGTVLSRLAADAQRPVSGRATRRSSALARVARVRDRGDLAVGRPGDPAR